MSVQGVFKVCGPRPLPRGTQRSLIPGPRYLQEIPLDSSWGYPQDRGTSTKDRAIPSQDRGFSLTRSGEPSSPPPSPPSRIGYRPPGRIYAQAVCLLRSCRMTFLLDDKNLKASTNQSEFTGLPQGAKANSKQNRKNMIGHSCQESLWFNCKLNLVN